MKLAEALLASRQPVASGSLPHRIWLSCGFTSLHFKTYLAAHGRRRFPDAGFTVAEGLFGDLYGNLERAREDDSEGAVVVVEWSDLDPRLGLRHSGGMTPGVAADTIVQVRRMLVRLGESLRRLAEEKPVVVAGPNLALPPLGHTVPAQLGGWEAELVALVAAAQAEWTGLNGVKTVSPAYLAEVSPPFARRDVRMDLATGFPYSLEHADAMAMALIAVLYPAAQKKGIITDLDNTLWRGILGEDGPDGVAWSLAGQAQAHGLYQQFLAALAERGVLIGVASKNDADAVDGMFRRTDLLMPGAAVFPVEANWGPKSESVARILAAWNIHAADVVFIDDSPMELAEVSARFPEMETIAFPANDVASVWRLLFALQERFGKPRVGDEDRIRTASLRASAGMQPAAAADMHTFLAEAGGKLMIDWRLDAGDVRALELVNKTNQFNLNGRRYSDGEWRALLSTPGAFLQVVSYQDRFGPLGKIAVAAGVSVGGTARVDVWVLSCRAFSRRIEHHMADRLFARLGIGGLRLSFQLTERNGPMAEFMAEFAREGQVIRERFNEVRPPLPHEIEEIGHD